MGERKPIVISWEEWKASREAKRVRLKALGLDVPSRRKSGIGSGEKRLRKAFGGARAPQLATRCAMAPDEPLQFSCVKFDLRTKHGKEECVAALWDAALDVIRKTGRASIAHFQRQLCIRYNVAALLVDELERRGIVGSHRLGGREILMEMKTQPGESCSRATAREQERKVKCPQSTE